MVFTVGLDTSALDVKFKSHAMRGIGRYVQELKNYFDSVQSLGEVEQKLQVGSFDHREFNEQGMINRLIEFLPAGRQTVRQQIVYPFRLGHQKKDFDILHFPAHMDAPAWSIKNYVLTVLDLIPLVLSDLYKANKPSWRFNLARWLEIKAIKNAGLILAISENTAKDVHEILGVPYEKIVVTPLGVNHNFFLEPKASRKQTLKAAYGIPEDRKIVLYVGGIDPRKNYIGIIESFSRLLEVYREKSLPIPCLVMAGDNKNDAEYPRLQKLIAEKGIGDSVLQVGFVADADLPAVYAMSSVLFFPSLYEGFGLTPLESMAAGTPVVSSNTSCMPEVLADAAVMIDPKDYNKAAQALFDVLETQSLRQDMIERGKKRATLYSWSKTGELTMQAYEKLMLSSSPDLCVNA